MVRKMANANHCQVELEVLLHSLSTGVLNDHVRLLIESRSRKTIWSDPLSFLFIH